jgi:hypothetical protein
MKDTIFNGKKNNTYYQTIFHTNRFYKNLRFSSCLFFCLCLTTVTTAEACGRREVRTKNKPKGRVLLLVKSKSHFSEPGLSKILYIQAGMNRGRRDIILNNDTNISNTDLSKDNSLASALSATLAPLKFEWRALVSRRVKGRPLIQKREFHQNVKARNRIGPHNLETISVIFGSLLGNGRIKRLVEGSMLVVTGTNKDYVQWLYTFFYNRGYTSNLKPRQYTRSIQSKEGKVYYGYEFNTFTFRSFSWIHKLYYNKGKKVVPLNIFEYLTPLALSV